VVACDDDISAVLGLPQASKGLRIAHLNCRSLLSHILELTMLLKLDVLTLSETWLDDTIPDSEILPVDCGYLLFRRDRNRHGGVWQFYYQIIFLIVHMHPDLSGGHVESIWGDLTVKGLYFCVVLIDHHPRWISMIILL